MADLECNKAVVRKFFDYLSKGNIDALMGLYSDSFTLWVAGSLPFSGVHRREVIPGMVAGVRSVFPQGIRYTPRSMTAEDDRVAVEADLCGEHVSGKTYDNQLHYLFIIRDGKIESFKEYFDTMHAHDVLCSAPAPGFNS
jgi:uncharacterized protein